MVRKVNLEHPQYAEFCVTSNIFAFITLLFFSNREYLPCAKCASRSHDISREPDADGVSPLVYTIVRVDNFW